MRLNFPIKNLTIHSLLDFIDSKEIRDFALTKEDRFPFVDNYFEKSIQLFKDYLPSFENEILQVINTTTQETIDFYFNELLDNISVLRERISFDNIKRLIDEYNKEVLVKFELLINENTDVYFAKPERELKHLEEYEANRFVSPFGLGYPEKYLKTNYNFYCVDDMPELIEPSYVNDYFQFIGELANEFMEVVRKYGKPYKEGKIVSKHSQAIFNKPVLFVEGEYDISYFIKAAELLNETDLLSKIEVRQRGGYRNLDKLVDIFKDCSWETVPQKKIILYDCDTEKKDEDLGFVFKRIIPTSQDGTINKGIENLFPETLVKKAIQYKAAFIDVKTTKGIKRGERYEEQLTEVNKDEKRNFCEWICKNGTAEDFKNFSIIFDLIRDIV